MPQTTIYGPQAWTSGNFSFPSAAYQSTAAAGPDAPISGYPDVWACEDVETQIGGGPSGQKILQIVPNVTFLSSAGVVLNAGAGALANNQFDTRGGGDGIVVEWWQYLTNNSTEVSLPNLLVLAHGMTGGTNPGLGPGNRFLQLEGGNITGASMETFLSYRHVSGSNLPLTSINGASITLDDAWHAFQIVYKPATVTGAYTGLGGLGSATVASDGSIHAYINATPGSPHTGTLIASVTGAQVVVNHLASANPDLYYGKNVWHGFASMVGPVTGTWIYYDDEAPDPPAVLAERNLFNGDDNTIQGSDSAITGVHGKTIGNRNVMFALDGATHTVTGDGTFWLYGNFIWNGTTFTSGSFAPSSGTYLTLSTDATLTGERVLTGTSNRITVTDGGAGTTATLSTPQDLHTGAVLQFARMGLGTAADSSAGLKVAGQYYSAEFDAGNSGTTKTIDWNNGNTQLVTMTGNCTFTLSNPKAGGRYLLVIDNTAGNTLTWPASLIWTGGTEPDLSVAGIHLVTLAWTGVSGGVYLSAANLSLS